MEFVWDGKSVLIVLAVGIPITCVNNLAIMLLDLGPFQAVISTTTCIVIALAIFLMLAKRGFFDYKAKNEGGGS
ncbi:MAG: hypothetical protein WCU80_12210 [Paludibacteraceae bacterium]